MNFFRGDIVIKRCGCIGFSFEGDDMKYKNRFFFYSVYKYCFFMKKKKKIFEMTYGF